MRPSELVACGCALCREALRTHALLDQLIARTEMRHRNLDRLDAAITRLERT